MARKQRRSRPIHLGRIREREALEEKIMGFNLLSNVFMSVALADPKACQHVLRVLTGIEDLIVKEVRSQYWISKIHSHDAVLDILAEDGKGKLFNLEIQRTATLDHAKRVRFYGAMVDSEYLLKGKEYADLPEVYIIYISETDLWKAGQTTYFVEKRFKGLETGYEDGQRILYVNAGVDDGSDIAKLMKYFKTADPDDMSQGGLSERVRFLKKERGGREIMCKICDGIYNDGKRDEREKWSALVKKKDMEHANRLARKDADCANKLAQKDVDCANKLVQKDVDYANKLAQKDALITELQTRLAACM